VSTMFKKRFTGVRLSPEEAKRQGQAATLAWQVIKVPGGAVAFLNTHDDALGGRPIDIAVASDEGLATVEAAIRAKAK